MKQLAIALDLDHHQNNRWGFCGTWYWYEHLINHYNAIMLDSQETYDKRKGEISAVWQPEFGCPMINYDTSLHHKIAFFLSDPHDPKKQPWVLPYIESNEIDFVLTPYYAPTLMHFPDMPKSKVLRFPWCIPDEFIATDDELGFYQSEKSLPPRIHIFGCIDNQLAYNARKWCSVHPSVTVENHSRDNRKYDARAYWARLKTYGAAIAAGSFDGQYGLVLPKYYEIAASGSLLFAQHYPNGELSQMGFYSDNCVPFVRTDFDYHLNHYLRNPQHYHDRRIAAVNLIRQRHSLSVRSEQLAELLEL